MAKKSTLSARARQGGFAAAESLTAQERSERARKAATGRWNRDIPIATHEGSFSLGGAQLLCANLPNGKRVITQATFLRSLGRSRSPKAGTGVLATADEVPFFLQAEALKPFITEELLESTKPIFYRNQDGKKGVGYDATALPRVAEIYLKFRDQSIRERGSVPGRYEKIIAASDILVRGLAHIGIVALVDEATGFQKDRASNALSKILEAFIAKELKPWVHTFPNEFYEQLFRLRGMRYPNDSVKKPRYFGHLTNNIIYARLAPHVLDELKKATPRDEQGRHKHQLHRRLTRDVGHPKLREHIASAVSLMKISDNYLQFERYMDRAHPKYNETLLLALDEPEPETGI
jgi:P63C domain